MCEQAGVKPESILTLDDVADNAINSNHFRWILVDHNKFTGRLSKISSDKVIGVLDHHEEENFVTQGTGSEPRVVEKAGSCTSLVLRYCRDAWNIISSASQSIGAANGQGDSAIDDSAFTQTWDAQIAKLALASILIDTSNLTNADKVEAADKESVAYLESKIMLSPKEAKSWNRKAFYKQVKEIKSNLDALTLAEILEKDYKQWDEGGIQLGISSCVKDLEFLAKKANSVPFESLVDSYMDEKGLDIFAIMTHVTSSKGERQRQIQLQARPGAVKHAAMFIEKNSAELKLDDLHIEGIEKQHNADEDRIWRTTLLQKEQKASRKQVAPMLRAAIT